MINLTREQKENFQSLVDKSERAIEKNKQFLEEIDNITDESLANESEKFKQFLSSL